MSLTYCHCNLYLPIESVCVLHLRAVLVSYIYLSSSRYTNHRGDSTHRALCTVKNLIPPVPKPAVVLSLVNPRHPHPLDALPKTAAGPADFPPCRFSLCRRVALPTNNSTAPSLLPSTPSCL
jgi:hypothetical protein